MEKKNWGVPDLLTACPTISLVVDLTNTYRFLHCCSVENTPFLTFCLLLLRYYSPKDLEGQGVKHVKILTEGRVVPSEGVVQQFYRYFLEMLPSKKQFQRQQEHDKNIHTRAVQGTEDGLIGVHCTHGLNRTGYLICR